MQVICIQEQQTHILLLIGEIFVVHLVILDNMKLFSVYSVHDDDMEFDAVKEDDADDEETLAEQEKRERGKVNYKEEISSLAKENEMPLSELLKLYDIDQSEIGTGQEEDDSNVDEDDDDEEVSTDPGM